MSKKGLIAVTLAAAVGWATTAGAAPTPAQKCEKPKNKAAAKYGQCIATQRGKEIGGKIPEYAECATKLTEAFTKAEQKAVDAGSACPTTGDEWGVRPRQRAPKVLLQHAFRRQR